MQLIIYSGGKKNPDFPIKSTENMTCRHCKRLVTTPTDVVLCLYSQLDDIALRILYIRCCELNYIHFNTFTPWLVITKNVYFSLYFPIFTRDISQ